MRYSIHTAACIKSRHISLKLIICCHYKTRLAILSIFICIQIFTLTCPVRRRTKEAYRLQKQILHDGRPVNLDLALIYSSKETLPYKTVANAVRRILESVVEHL